VNNTLLTELLDSIADIEDTMNIQNKDFIFTAFGVSGREDRVREKIEGFVRSRVDEITHDTTGSLVCVKRGTGGRRVMLSAHMDSIGFVITHIDESGFLRFSEVGHQIEAYLLGRRVVFESGCIGVIGSEKLGESGKLSKEKMFIDIGATSGRAAGKSVSIGDMCAVYSPYTVNDRIITGGWMDDRIGCFILLEVMENLKRTANDMYFVFSSQEEVGLRGATTTSYRIEPEIGIAVDVTISSDLPEDERLGSSVMGRGAAVKIMDQSVIVPKKLVDRIIGIAKSRGIPHQRDIIRKGGTDAHAMQLGRGGAIAGGVSIPTRYLHSSGEMCCLDDVQACIDLVAGICEDKLAL
jgi:endoglucanase